MNFSDYYKNYKSEKNLILTENQFAEMMLMLPSVLVSFSDGNFDELEKASLAGACEAAAGGANVISYELYNELTAIASGNEINQNEILSYLKGFIANDAESKEIVLDLMEDAGKASDGLSDVESNKISALKSALNLN
jgi:hypothetical protein